MPDSLSVIQLSLGHSRMERDSFPDQGSGKLWCGELFISKGLEDFSSMQGRLVIVSEYASEEKAEHGFIKY